jgi:CubicO group peptidase (beta-lactamase class C family)
MRISFHSLVLAVSTVLLAAAGTGPAYALPCQTCEMPDPSDPTDNPPKPLSPLEMKIDPLVWAQMLEDKLPGVTVAATRNGKLLFNKGYGYANTQTKQLMTASTRARIGSVTKAAITGPAGYQLMAAEGINPQTQTLYGSGGLFGSEFANDIARGVARHTPIVEMDIGQNDHTFTWYNDGTFSEGATNDLDKYNAPQPYTLPPSRQIVDITGIAIAGNGMVYTWYNDARTVSTDSPRLTRSIGTASDLDQYSAQTSEAVDLPAGKTAHDIVGIAIAKSNDHVYVWYQDGTYSQGTSMDFDYYHGPKPYTWAAQANGTSHDIRGMAIASNDHVYAWFGNGKASSGMSHNLAQYISPYLYTLPAGLAGPNWTNLYSSITIQNLLDHRAGFTRSGDTAGTAEMFGVPEASLGYKQIHQHFLRTRPLLRTPGGNPEYSNHGFGLWTLMIEKMSGQSYRDYVYQNYLVPNGVATDIEPQSTPDSRDSANHILVNGVPVPGPYEQSTTGLAAGGYRGTARALTVLTAKLDGKYADADMDRMGWALASDGSLEHNGGAEGGMAYVVMFPAGYTTPEGLDLGNVHIAVVANRWGSLGSFENMAREIAKQLPAP